MKLANDENNIKEEDNICLNNDSNNKKIILNFSLTPKTIIIILIATILGVIIGFSIYKINEKNKYDKLPIKVDISMTSYYGTIEYILYELDLDFDLVTLGANCLTGVQRNEFKTEKYGILYTEFRYCKSNQTTIFRVYNDEKDQALREPNEGELASFNNYGYKINDKNNL